MQQANLCLAQQYHCVLYRIPHNTYQKTDLHAGNQTHNIGLKCDKLQNHSGTMDSNTYRNDWVSSDSDWVFWSHPAADTGSIPAQHKPMYTITLYTLAWTLRQTWAQHLLFLKYFHIFSQDICSDWQHTAAVKPFLGYVLDLLSCSSARVIFVNFHRLLFELCLSLFLFWEVLITEHLLCFQTSMWWSVTWKKLHLDYLSWGGQRYSVR